MASRLFAQGPDIVSFRSGEPTKPSYGRGSPTSRGYDREWRNISVKFRQLNPKCVECAMRGMDRKCELVDHKVPVESRPDLRLDPRNWWSLCKTCHDTVKREMEAEAKAIGDILLLFQWCQDPMTRPLGLRYSPAVRYENGTPSSPG